MWLRISAIIMRFFFLHRRSVARVMEIFFWPVMNLLVWGFVTSYLKELALPTTVLFLIGSVILWDVLYRSQQGITLAITEEFWVKNIINIFISPISLAELLGAICIVGIIKSVVTTIVLAILAFFFYKFNLLSAGPGLALFLAICSCSAGPWGFLPWHSYFAMAVQARPLSGVYPFSSSPFQPFFTLFPSCLSGCRKLPTFCRRLMSLRACARYWQPE